MTVNGGEKTGHRWMTRANRGTRSRSIIEGRLLGAALQSLVSHANTQDRYSCNKGAVKGVRGDNVDISI